MSRIVPKEKVTFSLPARLVSEVREAVASGLYPSQNVLVNEALERELKRIRAEQLQREFEEAAKDPLFLRDLEDTENAFQSSDSQTARRIRD